MTAWLLSGLLGTAQAGSEPHIQFEKYELENGLDVILSQDSSVPFVYVNIWYNVGSKDEEPGKTGFAHLFEHLMFQGSQHYDHEYFAPLQPIGGQINGTTSLDRTNYFEGVPSEYLPMALWLESDRMGWLLPALTEEKLSNQKEVVRNERRQRMENQPYGMAWWWIFENLYPEGHPYNIVTIGKHEDIDGANFDDVKRFFKTWYSPNNASLVICGDFDKDTAKKLVQDYFGEIPRGPKANPRIEAKAELTSEKVLRKTDKNATDSKIWMAWQSPAIYQPGDAELDILSTLLTDGKDSLLHKKLVDELQIAKDISAYQYSARLHGQYFIEATAASGHTTDEIASAIDATLKAFHESEPAENEIQIAKTNWQAQFYNGLLSIRSKADRLNSYNILTGDPGYINKDVGRYLKVTAKSVSETAKQTLNPTKRVVLHITPAAKAPTKSGESK